MRNPNLKKVMPKTDVRSFIGVLKQAAPRCTANHGLQFISKLEDEA